jgi:putative addiction module component (TIGR02574 family)
VGVDSVLLKEEALKLAPLERAHLIDALWQSLDTPDQSSVDRAWVAESLDRLRAFRDGQLPAVDGEQTLADIKRELRR